MRVEDFSNVHKTLVIGSKMGNIPEIAVVLGLPAAITMGSEGRSITNGTQHITLLPSPSRYQTNSIGWHLCRTAIFVV